MPSKSSTRLAALTVAAVCSAASTVLVTVHGTVAADATMTKLIEAIDDRSGPRYDWRSVDPVDKADGGQPGGQHPARRSCSTPTGSPSPTARAATPRRPSASPRSAAGRP
ncbi:hypothetical protein SGRIM128S_09297 [Streptomyces griseomycini]